MIYPDNFEAKIAFGKLRELLKANCLCVMGEERVASLVFMTDPDRLTRELALTEEFLLLLNSGDSFPTTYFFDMRAPLSRIRIEGRYLDVDETVALRRSLETVVAITHFLLGHREKYPALTQLAGNIECFPFVRDRIDRILNPQGLIKDSASPELERIRRELRAKTAQVSKRLQHIMREAQREGLVDSDATIALRDGRPVIPVAAGLKRKVSGIVHDESASGKTAFIEPTEVVELNNDIRELENAERREIIRILITLADEIRPHIDELTAMYEFLGLIDFIRAKALLARRMDAVKPSFTETGGFHWLRAVHPLLRFTLEKEGRTVTPLDIRLSPDKHILLISGPNAGGKSVCLKTVGLLQYMLQCGLLLPVAPASEVCIFEHIFIDIGDEQSIENDLSTYSSHLLNMKFFLKNANSSTLVLIDEFGTGTEPMLGGAIAEAILAQLNRQGAYGVITTHYTNLKHFAASETGIENGAMLYDAHRMEPLFRLETGEPGSSFAFEIARKIGMPEAILQAATDKIGKDHIDFDKHLREVVRDKRYWEAKRERVRKLEKSLEETAARYEADLQKLNEQRKAIITEARTEAGKIVASANKAVENTIREIRESQAAKEKTRAARAELQIFREELETSDAANDEWLNHKMQKIREKQRRRKAEKPAAADSASIATPEKRPITAGDYVRMEGQNVVGEALEIIGKKAVVAFGNLRTTVAVSRLQRVSANEARQQLRGTNRTIANIHRDLSERRLSFKPELDVRGQRADEALANIQPFIDEALMLGVGELRILHGKGNGILKEVIRNFLKTEPQVRTCRDEHVQFGGAGITVVEMAN
ncbi:MAG: Smr/MutS family protein [Bacteroidales bacterium]|jgi:DNA mismatch repair protein MutS2|nr:Smr/MutS family protein [Bacteroidales bacterium]